MTEKKSKKNKEEMVDAEVVETSEEKPKEEEKPSITLKKAHIIETELVNIQKRAAEKLKSACTVTIDDPEEVEATLLEGKKELQEAFVRYNQVESFVLKLRTLKGAYNTQSGINSLLSSKAVYKRIASSMKYVVDQTPYKDLAKVQKQMRKEEERCKSADYFRSPEIEQFPLHVDEVEEYSKQLKALSKQIRQIDEQIGYLNYQTRIPLSDEDVQFLQGEDLL